MKREVTTLVVNGELLSPGAAALPGDSLGVLRGEGVFESFLVEDAQVGEHMEAHANRLRHSANLLDIPGGQRNLIADFMEIAPHLPDGVQRVRYSIYRGNGDGAPIRMWTAGVPGPVPPQVKVAVSKVRRDPLDPLVSAKTISRVGEQYARRQAVAQGAWEALLPTIDGDFAEFTSANLFVYQGGALLTPPLDRGLLAGTTRAKIMEVCAASGINVQEEIIKAERIRNADEIYLGNAVVGLVPVNAVIGLRDGLPGVAGGHLKRVRNAYMECKKPVL